MEKCNDTRKCGGRCKHGENRGMCMILESTYTGNSCPFCKPNMKVTKGVLYPDVTVCRVK